MSERKLTRRGSKRREQLLEAGGRLFADQGYHGTTVGDVCDTVGVGKGVFYWYFRSKEALFSEILQASILHLRRAQQAAIAEVEGPVARIEVGIRTTIEFFRANPGFLSLIRTAGRYDEFAGLVESGQQVVVSDVAIHIKEGMSVGEFREGDPELMAHGILGAIFHFVEIYFPSTLSETKVAFERPELAEEAVAFCLRGLLAR